MSLHEQLLEEIQAYLKATGMKEANFGIACINDSSLVLRLKRGRSPRLVTADEIRKFMADNPPS